MSAQPPDHSLLVAWHKPLRRYGWWVLSCAVVGGVSAVAVAVLTPVDHRASGAVHVVPVLPIGVAYTDIDPRGFQEVERFYRTQIQLIQRPDLLGAAAADLGLESREVAPVVRIEAATLARSQVVQITAVGPESAPLVGIADAVAERFVQEHRGEGLPRQGRAEVVQRAVLTAPSTVPRVAGGGLAGGLLGALVALGLIAARRSVAAGRAARTPS